ncbi:MAG: PfkB family carbohydrate kinase [Chloroflexi bacterium]|nr:PfkB family carbohydrate kinase [Chloroflexota bacterium]
MSTLLKSHVARLADRIVLVIGDVILDEYITGRVTRMSREAPVPVLELESKRYIAGGAANPAANIASLGGRAIQVGIVGEDAPGEQLRQLLVRQGIEAGGLLRRAERPTTVKTRILAQMGLRFPQQVTRIDTVTRQPIDDETESLVVDLASGKLADVNAVLLSHYHGGLLTPSLVRRIRDLCAAYGVLHAADVQGNFDAFSQLDVIKCNADDARRYLNRQLDSDEDFSQAARQLHDRLGIRRATIITRGAAGATLAANGETTHCPAPSVSDVYDTVGAGDTTIATLTLALAAGIDEPEALMLANYASGIVVRHFGNYAPTPAELIRSIDGEL